VSAHAACTVHQLENRATGKVYDVLSGQVPQADIGDFLTDKTTIYNDSGINGRFFKKVYLDDELIYYVENMSIWSGHNLPINTNLEAMPSTPLKVKVEIGTMIDIYGTIRIDYEKTYTIPVQLPVFSDITIGIVGSGTTAPPAMHYTGQYAVGSEITIKANPATGWKFKEAQRSGVYYTTLNPFTVFNLGDVEEITVVFEALPSDGNGGNGGGGAVVQPNTALAVAGIVSAAAIMVGTVQIVRSRK
jgi:hypothetical protein